MRFLQTDGYVFSLPHDEGYCDEWSFEDSSFEMVDIAGGDLDGDGRDEPILLFDDGSRFIYGVNIDSDDFGQETTEWVGGWAINDGPQSISAEISMGISMRKS